MKKKILSSLLCLCMLFTLIPFAAFASEGNGLTLSTNKSSYSVGDTIHAWIYLDPSCLEDGETISYYDVYINGYYDQRVGYAGQTTFLTGEAQDATSFSVYVIGCNDRGDELARSNTVEIDVNGGQMLLIPYLTSNLSLKKTASSGDYVTFDMGIYVPDSYTVEWKLMESSGGNPITIDSGTLRGGGNQTVSAGKTVYGSDSGKNYFYQFFFDNASTGKRDTLTSNTCTLSIKDSEAETPNVVVSPGSTGANCGESFTLKASAYTSDGGKLTYQWYYGKNDSFSAAVMLSGENDRTLNVVAPQEEGTYYYFCHVTNTREDDYASGYDYSRVTVTKAAVSTPTVKISPAETSVPASGSLNLTANASATGGGDLYYQWYYGTSNSFSSASAISGATGVNLITTVPATGGTYYYFCYVTHIQNGRAVGDYATSTVTVTGQTGMGNFVQRNVYNNIFSDVHSTDWFYSYVKNVYEYGLVNGKTTTTYCPYDNFTVAEALKIAACVHSTYYNGYDATQQNLVNKSYGASWYTLYVNYCTSNGIINTGDFTDYNANCTRAQMAYIFSRCLPSGELAAVKNVSIPDCNSTTTPYFTNIQTLYNAGVVCGDQNHFYNPNNPIRRSEVAKIVCTLILPATRDTSVF